MIQLLSESSVRAISGLGAGVAFEGDVRPALAAAGLDAARARASVRSGSTFVAYYFPSTGDDIAQSLANLDLSDPEVVGQVLRFATRIARVYAASAKADRAVLVRLGNALADDAARIGSTDDMLTTNGTGAAADAYARPSGEALGGGMVRVTINRAGIAQMMREIQREFDKHEIRIPVVAEGPELSTVGTTNIYHGPVVHGDVTGSQLAWGNETVHQTQSRTEQIAPGFEAIAQAVAKTLEGLPAVGLSDEDQQEAKAAANEVLEEVTRPEPDRRRIKRALMALKGFLAPVAAGLSRGAADGAEDWARTAVEQLGSAF